MMAVLYDISFAVEKAHDKMLDLSNCEKTKQIIKNVLDMVHAYIVEVSLVGKTIRVVKQGASAIYRMASNGTAAIGSGAAAVLGIISNGTATILGIIGSGVAAIDIGAIVVGCVTTAAWQKVGEEEEE